MNILLNSLMNCLVNSDTRVAFELHGILICSFQQVNQLVIQGVLIHVVNHPMDYLVNIDAGIAFEQPWILLCSFQQVNR